MTYDKDSFLAGLAVGRALWRPPQKDSGGYLAFLSASDFTLENSAKPGTGNWNGIIEYSTDLRNWQTWYGLEVLSSVSGKLFLRGTGNTWITGPGNAEGAYRWILTGSDIKCIGNIETLLDYATVSAGVHPVMDAGCFENLFYGCTSLTTAPALPATTLASSCYKDMFHGCTALTAAPDLPATTLAEHCYPFMFYGCTSLTTAPALPATTLASGCYDSMFEGCSSLTSAPALPATTLASYCYLRMFSGCTSLTTAPALPATTLASYCYLRMFHGCSSLTSAPALPATTLASYCYDSMFSGCTSLTTAPALPATTLASSCYEEMFYGCTSLTTAPALPATTLASSCYFDMFYGCSSLKVSTEQTGEYQYAYRIPTEGTGVTETVALAFMFTGTGGTFTGTPEINTTYYTTTQPVS